MRWSAILIFSFILNTFVFRAHCQVKMVLLHGTIVTGWASNVTTFKTVGDCTNGCLEAEHCFLMWFMSETCNFYSYLNVGPMISVTATLKSEATYVAFKTDISNIPNNTCPPSYKHLKFSVNSLSGEKYSWIKTSGQWNFANCRTGWKRFERKDETVVCMKYFAPLGYTMQPEAIIKCAQQNATLTGIASLEEAKWTQQEYVISNKTYAVWIGATRDCPDTPCTTFKWTDGYTKSPVLFADVLRSLNSVELANCFAIEKRNGADAIIFSQPCGLMVSSFVCGYQIDF